MSGIIGIDEVGRGCWAGPLLVVAATAVNDLPLGLKDSKQLSKLQRQRLFNDIVISCQLGAGWVEAAEIDHVGIADALRLGVKRALIALGAEPDNQIIMDGSVNYCPVEFTTVRTIIGADHDHPIVSAASIYAKVLRDQYMAGQASLYPKYGFEKHVGYGTKNHREALEKFGVCIIHRRSFRPVMQFIR